MQNKIRQAIMVEPIKLFKSFLFISTIIVATLSIARYRTTLTANTNNSKVAVPVIKLGKNAIEVNVNPAEEEKVYNFKIENTEGEKKSDVSMEYTIQFLSCSNLPLEFELYTNNNNVLGTTNLLNGNITDKIVMKYDDASHEYQLKIKWRENEKSYKYSNVIDYIQIIMDSVQKD